MPTYLQGGIMISVDRNAVAVGLLITVLVGQSRAQENPAAPTMTRTFNVLTFGEGRKSCGEFLQAADDERRATPPNSPSGVECSRSYIGFVEYAEGFLSGSNSVWMATNHVQAGYSINDRFSDASLWLENYCREHPLQEYGTAVIYLVNSLSAKEQTK
jgi:hypothetical protein